MSLNEIKKWVDEETEKLVLKIRTPYDQGKLCILIDIQDRLKNLIQDEKPSNDDSKEILDLLQSRLSKAEREIRFVNDSISKRLGTLETWKCAVGRKLDNLLNSLK